MEIRQHGDNIGAYPFFGGYGGGYGTGYTSGCALGVGGLVLLFIVLAFVAWIAHSGNDKTRDNVSHGNALLLANRQETNALAIAFARSEGRSETLQSLILSRVDGNGERLCNLARQSDDNAFRVINHGETWGFQQFSRERCHCGDHDRRRRGDGDTIIDFNTGVQTGLALGNRGLTNQQA